MSTRAFAGRARASGPTVSWRHLDKFDLARLVRDGELPEEEAGR
jgi:hypothetical protein